MNASIDIVSNQNLVPNAGVPGFNFKVSRLECDVPNAGVTVKLQIKHAEAIKVASNLIDSRRNDPTVPWKDVRNKTETGPA